MLLPGLVVSIFAKTVQGKSLTILFSFTIGVFPMVSNTLFFHMVANLTILYFNTKQFIESVLI